VDLNAGYRIKKSINRSVANVNDVLSVQRNIWDLLMLTVTEYSFHVALMKDRRLFTETLDRCREITQGGGKVAVEDPDEDGRTPEQRG
jgi:hypothetical protein